MNNSKIPITILCGFLGSGKTTLLNHILEHNKGERIAVIVNEFGEVNVDAKLVQHTSEKMIELSNGCICCTLRGDLIEGVHTLIREHNIDHIVIESTGIGEPVPIAQAFYVPPELLALEPDIPTIQHRVFVDSIITVVDSSQFMEMYQRHSTVEGDEFNRGYGQLLAEQIEGADILILNKADLASESQIARLKELFSTMNPRAVFFESEYGKIDAREILNTGIFDIEIAEQSSLWVAELEKEPGSEADEYGIETYVYSTSRRFEEQKLVGLLEKGLSENIFRSKGLIAIEGSDAALLWSQAGKYLKFEQIGRFQDPINAKSEIVFIGQSLNRRWIKDKLDNALIPISLEEAK
ncbi:MAG: GTP-binding protein [Bacteroidetes bacterium]|jgi:G3E family GTPase|nr:GTP-binding protein [Bacteroidota bacterium]